MIIKPSISTKLTVSALAVCVFAAAALAQARIDDDPWAEFDFDDPPAEVQDAAALDLDGPVSEIVPLEGIAPPPGTPAIKPQETQRMKNGVVYTLEDSLKSVEHYVRGNWYSGAGDYANAIDEYSKAMDLMPFTVNYRYARGVALTLKGDYGDAIDEFSDLTDIRPNEPSYLGARGSAYNYAGYYALAVEDLGGAIAMKPKETSFRYNRGYAYYQLGDYTNAAADLKAVLRIDPRHADAKALLAYMMEEKKNKTAPGAQKTSPKPPTLYLDAHYGQLYAEVEKEKVRGFFYGGSASAFMRAQHLNKFGMSAGAGSVQSAVDGKDGKLTVTNLTAYVSPIYRLGLRDYYVEASMSVDIPIVSVARIEVTGEEETVFDVDSEVEYSACIAARAAFVSIGFKMPLKSGGDAVMQYYLALHLPIVKKHLEIVPSASYYTGKGLSQTAFAAGISFFF